MNNSTMITIQTEPDMSIETGKQWLLLPYDPEGTALVMLLLSRENARELEVDYSPEESVYRIPHTAEVDARIVALINELADVRFKSPQLVQLPMEAG